MKLLVAGGDRVDAGKTTFAAGLLAHLRETADATPQGFKPRAGNDYWFDHDDVLAALEDGRLYGKDARRLVDAEGDGIGHGNPETLNPLHRLWQPTPGETGLLGGRIEPSWSIASGSRARSPTSSWSTPTQPSPGPSARRSRWRVPGGWGQWLRSTT